MFEYISFKNGKYHIKNEYCAFKLFYNYFLFRPRIRNKLFKKIIFFIDILGITVLKIFFSLRLYYFLPTTNLNQNFLVSRTGVGNYRNIVTLYEEDSNVIIGKKYHDLNSFKREIKFLELYSINTTKIKVPKHSIDFNSKTIKYEFLSHPCFTTEMRRGRIDRNEALRIFVKIAENLKKLYRSEIAYIHGDISPDNIYLINSNIYLIDFSDAEYLPIFYDFLFLLYRILQEYDEFDMEDFFEHLNSDQYLRSIVICLLGHKIDNKIKNEFFNIYKRKLKYKHE